METVKSWLDAGVYTDDDKGFTVITISKHQHHAELVEVKQWCDYRGITTDESSLTFFVRFNHETDKLLMAEFTLRYL